MTVVATTLLRADRRFLEAAPPARLGLLRVVIGGYALGYLLVRFPHLLGVARFDDPRFDPVGPLAWLPGPVTPGAGQAVLMATLVTGIAFVAGWRWRLSGPAFALLFLAVTTYRNSWGQIFHTDNLPALHLLLLVVSPAADAWSIDARRRGGAPGAGTAAHGWPVRLITLVTVLAYVVAGWAKLRNGGLSWVTGDVLRNHIAHDALRKSLVGGSWSSFGTSLLGHAWLFPPMAVLSLLVELGAPFALARRLRVAWVAAAWAFHLGVLALMLIGFPYQLSGVAYASFFRLERLPARLAALRPGRRRGRVRSGRTAAP